MEGSMVYSRYDIVAALAEFFGTAYFLFMGVGGCATMISFAPTIAPLAVPFAFGWSLFVNVWIWSPISGGVLNPAITIAMMVTNNLTIIRGALYIIAQFAGALLGSFLINVMLPNTNQGAAYNASTVLNTVSPAQGFFLEMFATSVLTSAVFWLATEEAGGSTAAFGIGMALFISAIATGPYTGASLNPARTFGPSIVSGNYGDSYWIYYIGPILGALLAAAYWGIFTKLEYEKCSPEKKTKKKKDSNNNVDAKREFESNETV
ncbi:11005_t:CDS:2 [Diversispora eburnea]|uniref:11005_t:CDS:1 n=1 Tax=Diversispora eburnea TaxID=1213867 RepID=A0A9N8Z6H9_9GLOM|nr:11005_t:CDS:2 [Diversispora eburnea]